MAADLFITGTDTGVGKTLVSALLCAALDGVYWKPIQTGATEDSDRRTVMKLAEIGEERTLPECYVFDPPVSPHLAAEWAGATIDLGTIRRPEGRLPGRLVVEGAGGVMVPVNENEFMLDLMRQLGFPIVVVARSALGTINHSLMTLGILQRAGLMVKGVVVVGAPNRDNERAIERYGCASILGRVPLLEVINRTALVEVFNREFDRGKFD
ncbi:MAG: dethiobiotin synthase [Acidobacteria bacterium]|nr:MAG: dethiobiotin synthase [Acidobacteriota bacterium]